MKTHTHHVVPRSRGGTDNPENLVELDFVAHAELHARDFLAGGPWFDFRQEGWPWLDHELKEAVKKEASRRHEGSRGCFGGGPPSCLGKHWWNDGTQCVKSEDSPGPEWSEGRLWDQSWTAAGPRDWNAGRRVWNDGERTVLSHDCPGPGWVPGDTDNHNCRKGRPGVPKPEEWKRQRSEDTKGEKNPAHGRRWVTDGQQNVFLGPDDETPEGFRPGRTQKRKT